jgi:hypothetical protein
MRPFDYQGSSARNPVRRTASSCVIFSRERTIVGVADSPVRWDGVVEGGRVISLRRNN